MESKLKKKENNMSVELIMACLGWLVWIIGFIMIIGVITSKIEVFETSLTILFIAGSLGFGFNIPAFVIMNKIVETSYEIPTSIVKTNNMTFINHMREGKVVLSIERGDASYWNSTNIQIKIDSGVNLYNNKVDDNYEVVLR